MEEMIVNLLVTNPKLAVLVFIISVFRIIFKPLTTLIQAYVDGTPGTEDNVKWAAFKETKFFKGAAFLADYFLSLKLPEKNETPSK